LHFTYILSSIDNLIKSNGTSTDDILSIKKLDSLLY